MRHRGRLRRCARCGYIVSYLTAPMCPECGNPCGRLETAIVDPDATLSQYHRGPNAWLNAVFSVAMIALLGLTSPAIVPGGWIVEIPIIIISLCALILWATYLTRLVRSMMMHPVYAPRMRVHFLRWSIIPLVLGVYIILAWTASVPRIFLYSLQSQFDSFADRVEQAPEAVRPYEHIGPYCISDSMSHGGVVFLLAERAGFEEVGFARSRNTPVSGSLRYEHLFGDWYLWFQRFD